MLKINGYMWVVHTEGTVELHTEKQYQSAARVSAYDSPMLTSDMSQHRGMGLGTYLVFLGTSLLLL